MKRNLGIAAVFIWIGFLGAISFMEAWLKFKAPGVTLPIGLGIGRLVFAAMNKVEWVLIIAIIISLFPFKKVSAINKGSLLMVCIILCLQTFWMLPILDARAEMYITGAVVPPSNIHFYYILTEGIKMISLIFLGISLFRKIF